MRKRLKTVTVPLAVLLVLGAGNVALGDALLEYRWSPGSGVSRASFSFAPGRMRVDIEASGGSATILYDEGARKMWIVDHTRRSYLEIGEDLLRQIRQIREQMEAQLSQLPPPVREQMERAMTPPGFTRLGELPRDLCEGPRVVGTETVRKVPAKVVDGCKSLQGARWVTCRFWFGDGRALGLNPEDFRVLSSFTEFSLEILKTVGLPAALGGGDLLIQPRAERYIDLGFAFPIVVKAAAIEEDRESGTMILEKVSTQPLPGTAFALPQGYTRVEISVPRLRQ